jgi:AcrR family transcriptional regulator
VFAERGFHRARIQDIAARARIAVGTVYNHFEQKEDVLRALLEERTEGFISQLEAHSDDPKPFEARLLARVDRVLHYVETHRAFFTVAADHGLIGGGSAAATAILGGKSVKNIARVRSIFIAVVNEGIAAGALEPSDPASLARFFGALVRGFTIGALQQDDKAPLAKDAAFVVRLFLHGASRSPVRASKKSR